MSDFWACTLAEVKALGAWCMIHGPEAWLALVGVCIFAGGFLCGLFLAALLSANGRDDDERH